MTKDDVIIALARKSGFEVVQQRETANQLWLMGRSHPDRWGFFSLLINELLVASDEHAEIPWTCDVSKKYLRRGEQLVFGWRLIFQATQVQAQYPSIIAVIQRAPRPEAVELQSQLLPGYKPGDVRGGVNDKGKGSSSAGSLPQILQRRT